MGGPIGDGLGDAFEALVQLFIVDAVLSIAAGIVAAPVKLVSNSLKKFGSMSINDILESLGFKD